MNLIKMSILPNKCVFMPITIPDNNMINITQSKEPSPTHFSSTTMMSSCLDVNLNVIRSFEMFAMIYLAASVLNTESASKVAYHKKRCINTIEVAKYMYTTFTITKLWNYKKYFAVINNI